MLKYITRYVLALLLFFQPFNIYAAGVQEISNGATIQINTDGTVSSQERDGNRLYLGGRFSQIGIDQPPTMNRSNLAEIGFEPVEVSPWSPNPNNSVEAIAITSNRIFVGGTFTQIAGQSRNYFAVFDKNTKDLLDIPLEFNGAIYALSVDGNTLYIGGEFQTINGEEHPYLAAINLQDYSLNAWNHDVLSPVRDITIEGDVVTVLTDAASSSSSQSQSITIDRPAGVTSLAFGDDINPTTANEASEAALMVDESKLGFQIPTLSDLLTFAIRAFFVIAGLGALFFLLLGALAWITSGGDKDNVQSARDKIQAAIVGVIMMVVVLAIIWTLEQVVFRQRLCFGISCPVTIPSLLEPSGE